MGLYKHVSPKRHVAWSNAPTVQCLDLGHMTRAMQKKATSQPTARSYRAGWKEISWHSLFERNTDIWLETSGPFLFGRYEYWCVEGNKLHIYIYIYIYLSSWVFKGSCRFKTNASSSGLTHHALDNALPGSTSAFALSGWPSLSLLALSMVTRFLKTASGMTGGMMHVWKVLSIISELLKIWSLVSGGLYSPLNFSFMHLKGIKVPRG